MNRSLTRLHSPKLSLWDLLKHKGEKKSHVQKTFEGQLTKCAYGIPLQSYKNETWGYLFLHTYGLWQKLLFLKKTWLFVYGVENKKKII